MLPEVRMAVTCPEKSETNTCVFAEKDGKFLVQRCMGRRALSFPAGRKVCVRDCGTTDVGGLMLLLEGFVFGGCRLDHKRVLVPSSWQAEDVSGLCPDSVAHEPFRSSRKRINFIGFF